MKNKQFSYTIDNIGRIHIEVTNDLITGIRINDNIDYYYDRKTHPIIEDDFIMKVGVELIKYSTHKITTLSNLPIFIDNITDFVDDFYTKVMDIPYGETENIKDLVTRGQLGKARKLLSDCPLQLLIPTHRVIDDKINPELNYYMDKVRVLESSYLQGG